jgi:imidazolonepropionase-like amidohydrolase
MPDGAEVIDAKGCTLLPGLIDAHTHVDSTEHLENATKAGITTMFEMGNDTPELLNDLKNREGLTSIVASCYMATAEPKLGNHAGSVVTGIDDAERYVKEVTALGADFIKIFIEDPIPDPVTGKTPVVFTTEVLSAIVTAAHRFEKLTVAHVTTPQSYQTALDAGVDVLTHTPFEPLPKSILDTMAARRTLVIPTIVMMQGIESRIKTMNPAAPIDLQNVFTSVARMHEAGITILAGTDANDRSHSPCQFPHGASLHHELEFYVRCGLTPVEVLQSATSLPASTFGLSDRGRIETGCRADLLLVEGDPTADISAIRNIKKVWVKGNEMVPVYR